MAGGSVSTARELPPTDVGGYEPPAHASNLVHAVLALQDFTTASMDAMRRTLSAILGRVERRDRPWP